MINLASAVEDNVGFDADGNLLELGSFNGAARRMIALLSSVCTRPCRPVCPLRRRDALFQWDYRTSNLSFIFMATQGLS